MIRDMKHRYHIIYRTTCLVTNHFYVGMHSTNVLNDGYFGSGKIIRNSLRKHGKENHIRETLARCSTREDLTKLEAIIVNDELLADHRCMNLTRGGNTMPHEYDKSLSSRRLQARSLCKHYADHANRERQRIANTKACQRLEVVQNIAKKLDVERVLEIRRLYTQESMTYEQLGTQFNVSATTIWMITSRRTWKTI